jgi:hypothetical protein
VKAKSLDRVGEVKLVRRKSAKGKGSRKELETIEILKSLGFTCTKAGGSFGSWDVVGYDDERVLLIQVKSNRWPAQIELRRLMEGPVPDSCARLIFRFDDRKPLKVATMIEKSGRIQIHVLENSAYTQAQATHRGERREVYAREKRKRGSETINRGGCDDGTKESEFHGDESRASGFDSRSAEEL